jgi:superfamily II DNA/RNA helicase
LNEPEEISIAIGKTASGVTQAAYMVFESQKEALIRDILTRKNYEAVIIFASTKEKVKSIFKLLKKDFEVEAFHSDLEQVEREKIMSRFKNRSLKILIGTDIISRGIDVTGIELVVNFDTPNDPEDYVHRVGRTARADAKGEAITFISDKDQYKFVRIEKLIGMEIEKLPLPEGFGDGPAYKGTQPAKSHQPTNRGPKEGQKKPSGKKKKQGHKPRPVQEGATAVQKPSPNPSPSPQGDSKYSKRKNVLGGEG